MGTYFLFFEGAVQLEMPLGKSPNTAFVERLQSSVTAG
jgi:hypothetical protein